MKKLLAIIIVVIIIATIFYAVNCNDTVVEDGNIRIYDAGEQIATISYDEIKQLKSYRRQVSVHSTSGDFVGDFRGAMLVDVLDKALPNWADLYDTAKISGADGYYTELTYAEITAENNAFIMYSDGDNMLKALDSEMQSGRLVVIGDDFGQRFTNYVNEIHLAKVEE